MRVKVAVFFALLLTSLPLLAGALMPCVKASSSASGNFLVVTTMEYQSADAHKVQQVTLDIFPKETFINAKDRVVSPSTFWNNSPLWSVVLNSANSRPWVPACPVSLVTDDGEFLVIIGSDVVAGGSPLRIFRRRDHPGKPFGGQGPDHGVLVRDIPLNQLWPAGKLSEASVITDESPEWYAGGTFVFSSDSRTLVHKSRWGATVRVKLSDGSVSSE